MRIPGMVRKIDDLGRIVIPSELRRALEISSGDALELSCQGDALVLRKFSPACIFCGGLGEMLTYQGKNVCAHCVRQIKSI